MDFWGCFGWSILLTSENKGMTVFTRLRRASDSSRFEPPNESSQSRAVLCGLVAGARYRLWKRPFSGVFAIAA
jgi:hypothetical protein